MVLRTPETRQAGGSADGRQENPNLLVAQRHEMKECLDEVGIFMRVYKLVTN